METTLLRTYTTCDKCDQVKDACALAEVITGEARCIEVELCKECLQGMLAVLRVYDSDNRLRDV